MKLKSWFGVWLVWLFIWESEVNSSLTEKLASLISYCKCIMPCYSTKPKLSLKIGTANAICWNSLGLFRDYSLNHIFFRNKTFLFFNIGFQHWCKNEFRETTQNFNSIRQWIEKMKIKIVWMSWMSWNFVTFHEINFQTDTESFSLLSWKTKKLYA